MNERHAAIAATALRKVAERLETLDPNSLRPYDIARLLEIASRAERMARGVLDEPVIQERPSMIRAHEIRRLLKQEGLLGETLDSSFSPDPLIPPAERSGRSWPWRNDEPSDT
jgi:hypothetical protein